MFVELMKNTKEWEDFLLATPKRVRALFRYIRRFGVLTGFQLFWKLYAHPLPKHETIETARLPFYANLISVRLGTSDVSVFQEVFLDEVYDLAFLNLNPKIIVDGGAYVGFTSIFFAHAYPQARIFAIEPEERNFQMLLRNTKFYPNIIPIHVALWTREGKLQITDGPNAEKSAFQVVEWTKEKPLETVEALTMDKLLTIAKTNTIDILKLDIEGAEIELFSANYENWLEKTNAIIIELHDRIRKGCSETFYNATDRYYFRKEERKGHVILFKTTLN